MKTIIYTCDICKSQPSMQHIFGYRFDTESKPPKGLIEKKLTDNQTSHICEFCIKKIKSFEI